MLISFYFTVGVTDLIGDFQSICGSLLRNMKKPTVKLLSVVKLCVCCKVVYPPNALPGCSESSEVMKGNLLLLALILILQVDF